MFLWRAWQSVDYHFVISQLPSLSFQSLRGFVDGTKGMLKDEAYQLAKAEHSTLFAWIKASPAVRQTYRPREIENLVDYYWHLDFLIHRCETGYPSTYGYAATLSEEALKQWGQNAKPDSVWKFIFTFRFNGFYSRMFQTKTPRRPKLLALIRAVSVWFLIFFACGFERMLDAWQNLRPKSGSSAKPMNTWTKLKKINLPCALLFLKGNIIWMQAGTRCELKGSKAALIYQRSNLRHEIFMPLLSVIGVGGLP
jgi:hypothetical protein